MAASTGCALAFLPGLLDFFSTLQVWTPSGGGCSLSVWTCSTPLVASRADPWACLVLRIVSEAALVMFF